jgi:hypothetical protein
MEIVHYFDSDKDLLLQSQARSFYKIDNGYKSEIKIPMPLMYRFFAKFRLLRRLFRLDKSNCHPLFNENGKLDVIVIIYQSIIYLWNDDALLKIYSLTGCRNVMHQAITECEKGYLYFGEYGSNKNRDEVPVYRSTDRGRSWHIIYYFAKGDIKHIHSIQWDPYEKKLWLCTGDQNGECKIVLADSDFKDIEILGDGTQLWRTCQFIFKDDYVIWGMDSPLVDCFMIKMNRKNRNIELLSAVSGPIWYARRWSNGRYLVTTSVEPGVNCKDNKVKVYQSIDLHNWDVLWEFDKDKLHPVYFKFGSIGFSNGNEGKSEFYMHFEAVKNYDGQSVRVNEGHIF